MRVFTTSLAVKLLTKVFAPRVSPRPQRGWAPHLPLRLWGSEGGGVCASGGPAESATPVIHSPVSQSRTLRELVSSGCYDNALDVWEETKAAGHMDSASYTVVMAMCERLGSGELATAMREDMRTQNIAMDTQCSLYYVRALIAGGRGIEVVSFIRDSPALTDDPALLSQAASLLLASDHPHLALDVCRLTSNPCDPVVCVWLECLGSLRRVEEVWSLVDKVYGGVGVAPERVQLAVVHALSLADQHSRAMELVSDLRDGSLPVSVKTVSLLLMATARAGDVVTAVRVFTRYWEEVCTHKERELSTQFLQCTLTSVEEGRGSHLLSTGNSCLHLQALALKDAHPHTTRDSRPYTAHDSHPHTAHNSHPHTTHDSHPHTTNSEEAATPLKKFMEFDFYTFLRRQNIFPDSQTYEALVLRVCFDEGSVGVADRAIRTLFQAGSPLTSSSFVEWTCHCGSLSPDQATRVLSLIRRHYLGRYNILLSLNDYRQLLGVELVCTDPTHYKQALVYIRTIKNAMHSQGHLSSVHSWNSLFAALARLDAGNGPLFIYYDDMMAQGVEPNLDTYKGIADAAVSKRAAYAAAFDWWRVFNDRVSMDIALMNRLMECCLVCGESERAFFFFGLLKDYQLQPTVDTFLTLFKVCEVIRDGERLSTLAGLAHSVLPRQVERVEAAVRGVRDAWVDSEHQTITDPLSPSTLLQSIMSPSHKTSS